jgi:hypothetical protein
MEKLLIILSFEFLAIRLSAKKVGLFSQLPLAINLTVTDLHDFILEFGLSEQF